MKEGRGLESGHKTELDDGGLRVNVWEREKKMRVRKKDSENRKPLWNDKNENFSQENVCEREDESQE